MKQSREYLEAKVNTASPAQLHLMLLEGSLRYGSEAEKGLLRGEEHSYHPPLLRTMDIVEELLASVRHSDDEVNEKLAQLYAFVYSRLTSAYVNGEAGVMGEALRVLEYQRDTWRLACERIASERTEAGSEAPGPAAAATKPKAPTPRPHLGGPASGASTGGLSIEA